jgi:hypothetical protein
MRTRKVPAEYGIAVLCVAGEGLGQGSRFEIRIPLSAAVPDAQRVPVVDDNVDAAESLSLPLQAEGHQTELARRVGASSRTGCGPHRRVLTCTSPSRSIQVS